MRTLIAVDTNAVVDFIRNDRPSPPQLLEDVAHEIVLPVTVLGELYAGIHLSERSEENIELLNHILSTWSVIPPDAATAQVYGRLRAEHDPRRKSTPTAARMNDLWIAALCIQHDLVLLTRDAGFRSIQHLKWESW